MPNNLVITLKEPFEQEVKVSRKYIHEFEIFSEEYNMPWWDHGHKKFL